MNNRPRIIPTLLIDKGNLVKTVNFSKPHYLGDPINAIKIFNEKCVDELCVLDISSTVEGKDIDYNLLEYMASESFMPLSYGGGIKNIDQVKKIFRLGFEKVIINSSFPTNPQLIKEVSDYFGSQSICVSIDYKHTFLGNKCYTNSGHISTKYSPIALATLAEKMGAGEILLYCINNDGKRCGYDVKTISEIANSISIPVIACGGANSIDDFSYVFTNTHVSAVAAGSMFVYYGARNAVLINYPSEEDFIQKGIFHEDRI